jgi:protein-S-isoprenylcysteine O-methyltransferase Ste14
LALTGSYRVSCNSAFVGIALLYISLALTCGGIMTLLLLVAHLVIIRYGVIAHEKRCLSGEFCDDYRCYTTQVRRWI